MKILTTTVARILIALPFLVFGLMHMFAAEQMTDVVPAWLPAPVFWVYFTGLCMIAGGASIVAQKYAALGSKLLSLLLAIIILTIQLPMLGNPEMQQMAIIGFLKDLGLLGATLTYARLFEEQDAAGRPTIGADAYSVDS